MMPTMHDLGHNPSETTIPPSMEKYYPNLHLTSEEIPEVKDWKVKQRIRLEIEVVVDHHSESADGPASASLEVRKAGVLSDTKRDSQQKKAALG